MFDYVMGALAAAGFLIIILAIFIVGCALDDACAAMHGMLG